VYKFNKRRKEVFIVSKLTEVQISLQLKKLPQWRFENDILKKTYSFPKFMDSIHFVNQAASLAEAANHHPDLLIQYNKVTVSLTTHDEHGVTGKDILLAEQLEKQKLA